MNESSAKTRPLVSSERLEKLRAQYPEFFKFNESGLIDVNSPAADISEALMVTMLECSDGAFLSHCRMLSDFARCGNYHLWALSFNQKLNPARRLRALKTLVESLHKSLSDLEWRAVSDVEQSERLKKNTNVPANAISFVEFVARQSKDWPALIPRNNKRAASQRDFIIKKLGLAKDYPFNVQGKRAVPQITTREGKRITSPGYTAAELIITKILSYRSNNWPAKFNFTTNESLVKEARLRTQNNYRL